MPGYFIQGPLYFDSDTGKVYDATPDKQAPWQLGYRGPYTGFVGTNAACGNSYAAFATQRSMNCRMASVATVAITPETALQLIYGSMALVGGEVGGAAPLVIVAALEYPIGTITKITWNGAANVSIAALTTAICDPININIPVGARFYIRTYVTVAANNSIPIMNVAGICDSNGNEAVNVSTGALPDLSMGGVITENGGSAFAFRPLAIIGKTSNPSFWCCGDSREVGTSDTLSDVRGFRGELGRVLGPLGGYTSMAAGGLTTAGFNASCAISLSLLQYASHAICTLGINEIANAVSAPSTLAILQNLWNAVAARAPSLPIFQSTLPPEGVTTTDAYVTIANQTISPRNAARIAVNLGIRNQPAPLRGIIELADVMETARDSGIWNVPSLTADGTHETRAGNTLFLGPITAQLTNSIRWAA